MKKLINWTNSKRWYLAFLLGIVLVLLSAFSIIKFNTPAIGFNKEIRPILNSKCTGCHGGVKKAGGISFIYRDLALGVGESGKQCIVPGDPDKSEFIARLTHHDAELRMPLGKEALTKQEIDLLRQWVKEGANWEEHWAYVKPEAQKVPDVSATFVNNEIDNFIIAKREALDLDLDPSVEASKEILLRRLSLDLTGLPPSSAQLHGFLSDKSDKAYEKAVDKLLASPAYGERWAGMWLDLARYADTKGYEKDQFRNMWRYRDYLIKSFNDNKPYNVFIEEQLAGDLYPKPSEEQIIATAFHRNTLNNDEGGTDDEEFRTAAVIDRVNTTFDVFQGITMGCVQCHSHPYDPIEHKEYYQMMAYMNNTADSDHFDEIPNYIAVEDTPTQRIRELMIRIDDLNKYKNKNESHEQMKRRHAWPRVQAEHASQQKGVVMDEHYVHVSKPGSFIKFSKINFDKLEAIKLRASSAGGSIAQLFIDDVKGQKIAEFDVPENFGEWFEYGQNIRPLKGIHDLYVLFKTNKKGFCNSSIDYFNFYENSGVPKDSKLNAGTFDQSNDAFKLEKMACCWKPGGWILFKKVDLTKSKSISFKYEAANGFKIEFRNGSATGALIATADLKSTGGVYTTKTLAITPLSNISNIAIVFKANQGGACDGLLEWIDFNSDLPDQDNPISKSDQEVVKLRAELQKYLYTKGIPVMKELPEKRKRVTRVFHRGNWMAKTDTVLPGTPKILNKMPEDAPSNRLGMAKWLTSKDNPLTARVAVNRFWEQLFGYGIVETLEDFGSQGMKPTHPELLDYLALKFQNDFNWDVKKLLKYYVMSATYRQSSEVSEKHLKLDSRNRYLARAPRVRLTSEQVRDQALAVTGLLSNKMYGPSVMPYQPEGIWQTVYNGANWETSPGEDRYRRMLYTFIRRSAPFPNMLTFDGPSREFCVVRRIRTNTPLQALATLNDTTFVEASQALARKMVAVRDTSVKSKIAEGYKIALMQAPDDKSLQALVKLHARATTYYAGKMDKAYQMAGDIGKAKTLAPYTLVANAILNTDQFITKE